MKSYFINMSKNEIVWIKKYRNITVQTACIKDNNNIPKGNTETVDLLKHVSHSCKFSYGNDKNWI